MPTLRLHSWAGRAPPQAGSAGMHLCAPWRMHLEGACGARLFRTAGWSHGVREGRSLHFVGRAGPSALWKGISVPNGCEYAGGEMRQSSCTWLCLDCALCSGSSSKKLQGHVVQHCGAGGAATLSCSSRKWDPHPLSEPHSPWSL